MRHRTGSHTIAALMAACVVAVGTGCPAVRAQAAGRSRLPAPRQDFTRELVDRYWKAGRTLPIEASSRYPLPALRIKDDTGLNVLVDMAHKCNFFLMWNLGRQLHLRGLRTAGSHAALDSLLKPGSPCRVRLPVGPNLHPFGWWPAPRWNVILTGGGLHDPGYLPSECNALLEYVRQGGGAVVFGLARLRDPAEQQQYSLNRLLAPLGASFVPGTQRYKDRAVPLIGVGENWQVTAAGDSDRPVVARRFYGKGRVVLLASISLFQFNNKDPDDVKAKADFLAGQLKWAAAGSAPAGGQPRLPTPMAGGGGIYPEQETRVEGIVVYYSANQIPVLLETVRKDFPAITRQLYEWYPSPRPAEPMYLVVASSGGGGWAVNAYYPKEVGTITTSPEGLRSIFAHEQAHTMSGPCHAADHPFGGNQGEEHAGWFQGKIVAKYEKRYGPNRNCDAVFRRDYDGSRTDPEQIFKSANLQKWRTGHDRLMIWYVWQKLDDRYGPTWYPRWRWVQQQRWADQPRKRLTWEESIEDMCIAVGEDLFPFFARTGKQLGRRRLEQIDFTGRALRLPVAPIEPTKPGGVKLGPIGDYTKPLR